MRLIPLPAPILLSMLVVSLAAQTTTTNSPQPTFPSASVALQGVGSGAGPGAVFSSGGGGYRGLPFSLTEVNTTVQTLADGTHITRTVKLNVMRDVDGRTRTETFRTVEGAATPVVQHVEIFDPLNRIHIFLSPMMKTADITHMPVPHQLTPEQVAARAAARAQAKAASASQPEQPAMRPHMQTERLGSKTVAGVYVEGWRTTRIIPAGLDGNDREMRSTTEVWASPDLHVELERTTEDPRMGTSTMTVTGLERVSPDPALFQVPPDYKVIDRQPNVMP